MLDNVDYAIVSFRWSSETYPEDLVFILVDDR